MEKKLRVGLVGIGGMGSNHLRCQLGNPRVEVVAICDILPEKMQAAKDRFDIPSIPCYTDFKEMIDNEQLDAVDISTPNYLHSIVAVYAMERGLHVFCEKPDAVSVEEALKMKEASERTGKILMVMRNNRYYTNSQYLKKLIASGECGEIYCGRCGWIRRRGIPGRGGWFTTKAQSGGGPLIDLGVHMIDLAMWLMGNPKPVSVSGCTYNKFANNTANNGRRVVNQNGTFDVEDLAMGFIRFENGACLQIEFSWASNIEKDTRFVELRGTQAGIKWCDDGSAHVYGEENNKLTTSVRTCEMGDGHDEALKHFAAMVLDGAEPDYVPQQGINMIRILSAIYESAKTGREVILD